MSLRSERELIGRLDVDLLSALIAVHETGGVTRAAERLNRTQPAVSMQLRRLEERVGKQLIRRGRRSFGLTSYGEELLPYAKRIVDLCEEARQRMATPRLSGTTRVGIPEWFATSRMQAMLCRFSRLHPSVRLDLEVGASVKLCEMLRKDQLDLALGICDLFDGYGEQTWREPLYWVAGSNFDDADDTLPLALFHEPCPYRKLATETLDTLGRHWREAFTSTSVEAVRVALFSNLGVSIFPAGAIDKGLRILRPDEGFPALPPTELSIYKGRGELPESAHYLLDYLSDYVTDALSPYANPAPLAAVNL